MTNLQNFVALGKPLTRDVQVEVMDSSPENTFGFYKKDQASSKTSSMLNSAARERRDFNTQTTFTHLEMKDASVGRGLSTERLMKNS